MIDIDKVIGGEQQVGNGWSMLMECLAAGRGICLPATANASSKTATYGIYNYILHRRQFNIPLIKMEAISTKFLDMVYNTWVIQSSVDLTNQLLDNGEKPSVISAVMKQQTTERGRVVLNHAMDIYAGSSICLGRNNFLEKFYRSAPIGITVEGSNTLTKHLIIFGQGLNKSHPYISDIYNDIVNNDIDTFTGNFNKLLSHVIQLYFKSIFYSLGSNSLKSQTINFAHLSNIVAMKGGAIKKQQQLSGDMADIFSNLYLAYSVKWNEENNKLSPILSTYCIERLLNENTVIFNRIIENEKLEKLLLIHIKRTPKTIDYKLNNELIDEIIINPKIIQSVSDNVYMENNILEDLENLNKLEYNSKEYIELYNKVISVGEYPIEN